jgi:hypothetical protein
MILLALSLLLAAPEASSPDTLFADANAAFLGGDPSRAAAAYEALIAEGVASPELETNLGVAYLRLGKRGLAALHFERALFLDSGDDDARADLAELRRGNVDRLEGEAEDGPGETLSRALVPLPGGASAAALVTLWTLAWVALALRLGRPRRGLGVAAGALFGLAAVAAVVTFAAAKGRALAFQRAVIVAAAVPAREGPADRSTSHFEVHEGTTVRVEDEEPAWRRVRLANGLTGWVPRGTVELVVPPGWAGRPVPASGPRAAAN